MPPKEQGIDRYLVTDPKCIKINPSQMDRFVTMRPVRQDKVEGLIRMFESDGYLNSSANVVIQHKTGTLGAPDAKYGIVDGHHRTTAVNQWTAETTNSFQVTLTCACACNLRVIVRSPKIVLPLSLAYLNPVVFCAVDQWSQR
jgi:hypothetical protein